MNGILWSVFFFFFLFFPVLNLEFFFFIDQKSELKVSIGNVDFQYFDFEEMLREKLVVEILAFFFYRRMERLFCTIVKIVKN